MKCVAIAVARDKGAYANIILGAGSRRCFRDCISPGERLMKDNKLCFLATGEKQHINGVILLLFCYTVGHDNIMLLLGVLKM